MPRARRVARLPPAVLALGGPRNASGSTRTSALARLLGAAVLVGGCGSARTELPTSVAPGLPLQPTATEPATQASLVDDATGPTAPDGSVSDYRSPGEKHPVAGGTLSASYPRVGVRPPSGVAAAPAGQSWAVLNVRFCAGPQTTISGDLVDPNRFRVEVPGQGLVDPAPGAPALTATPLPAGTTINSGTCKDGSIAFLIAGEGHIEATTYDSGTGLLRWAT